MESVVYYCMYIPAADKVYHHPWSCPDSQFELMEKTDTEIPKKRAELRLLNKSTEWNANEYMYNMPRKFTGIEQLFPQIDTY